MTTASTRAPRSGEASRTWIDRFLAAVPLLGAFLVLLTVYAWQAWALRTPWVFTDELEFTQLARSFAETGETARRGEPHSFNSLAVFLAAPAWLIDDVGAAYEAAKYIGVATMTASVFPAYWLARLLVDRPAALFAAVGTAAIPAFMYSSLLVSEPLAYTWSALCLFLIVKALATWRPAWLAGAAVASLIAPLVRTQLAVVPAVFALAALVLGWRSERGRRLRSSWSLWDHAGAALLAVGAAIVLNELASNRSQSWDIATRLYKDRMLEYGVWAGGAFAVGVGLLPVVIAFATLARRDLPATREAEAFRIVLGAAIAAFGFYTALKAAYVSTVFATRVYERNLIYLAPLVFAATALWLERPRLRLGAVALGAVVAAVLVGRGAVQLEYPYFEAPGFGLLAWANREYEWSQALLENLLWLVLVLGVLLLLAPLALGGRRRLLRGLLGLTAALVLAWNVAGQLSASGGSRSVADLFAGNFADPPDWIDRRTGGASTVFLGQPGQADKTGIWLLEFWNRSLEAVWSLDGSAPGPGPTLTPDLADARGRLSNGSEFRYLVTDGTLDVVGPVRERQGSLRLVEPRRPLRLRWAVNGLYPDGWMGAASGYSRFSTPGGAAGRMVVNVSRAGWGGTNVPGEVVVRIGEVEVGPDGQARIRRETARRSFTINAGQDVPLELPAPRPPFRVEVTVEPTFVPQALDPRIGDARPLGAQIGYRFVPRGGG